AYRRDGGAAMTAQQWRSTMHRTFKLLAPTAIIGLWLTVGQAAAAPLPPRVNFVATPASQLHLGMTADEVIRVMGKSARQTDFAIGTTQIRKFELADAFRGQVILRDGKVTRVTLDVFRDRKGRSLFIPA